MQTHKEKLRKSKLYTQFRDTYICNTNHMITFASKFYLHIDWYIKQPIHYVK